MKTTDPACYVQLYICKLYLSVFVFLYCVKWVIKGLAYSISWSVYQDNGRSIPLRSLGLRNLDTPSKSQPGLWLALGNSQKFLGNNQKYSVIIGHLFTELGWRSLDTYLEVTGLWLSLPLVYFAALGPSQKFLEIYLSAIKPPPCYHWKIPHRAIIGCYENFILGPGKTISF